MFEFKTVCCNMLDFIEMISINLPCTATKCDVAEATSIAITSTQNRIILTISTNLRNICNNKVLSLEKDIGLNGKISKCKVLPSK